MRAGEVDLVGNLRKLLSCDESPLAKDDLRTRDPLGTYRQLLYMAYADLLTASPVSVIDVMEESQPPSPSYGPPNNFGEVAPGIYRSSFPKEPNFDHLAQLELKTILYAYSS